MGGRQDRGARLRAEMVGHLKEDRGLTDPRVEAALREVPRHLFLPGTGLAEAYADEAVVTRYKDGLPVSAASAYPAGDVVPHTTGNAQSAEHMTFIVSSR